MELIWVVDSVDQKRMSESKEELHKFLKENEINEIPLLIYCNKQDIIGAFTCEEVSEALDLKNCPNNNWNIFSCNGLTKNGLEEGMEWLGNHLDCK